MNHRFWFYRALPISRERTSAHRGVFAAWTCATIARLQLLLYEVEDETQPPRWETWKVTVSENIVCS